MCVVHTDQSQMRSGVGPSALQNRTLFKVQILCLYNRPSQKPAHLPRCKILLRHLAPEERKLQNIGAVDKRDVI